MNTSKRKGKQRKKSLKTWIIATLLLSIIYVWLQ
ncbi:M15 family peptidase, partial [Clostridioides difficile]